MGILTLKEDRPTPPAVYGWRLYTCAAVASFASCTIGYDSGLSSSRARDVHSKRWRELTRWRSG